LADHKEVTPKGGGSPHALKSPVLFKIFVTCDQKPEMVASGNLRKGPSSEVTVQAQGSGGRDES
jgi:hypothetical protein